MVRQATGVKPAMGVYFLYMTGAGFVTRSLYHHYYIVHSQLP